MNLDEIKKEALIFDIETSAIYPNGKEININADFDSYLEHAVCKFFGAYSYKYNKSYYLEVLKNREFIKELFEEHNILVGFNNQEFDFPILQNNRLIDRGKFYTQVDCMQIMGKSTFKDKKGFSYKGRGELMNYKFKNNKLRTMAEEMKLDFQKGDIDYKIFQKDSWNKEEISQITTYLKNDIMGTKQIFDKLWEYWMPFTELLDAKNIKNLSWIRSSIGSLTYKCACHAMGTEPTYAEGGSQEKEEMGGHVIDPKYEEATDVWYVDFTSLYPHILCLFGLFSETTEKTGRNVWHGNDVFKVEGHYNISSQHILSKSVQKKLKERIELKKNDPNNPMVYTLKNYLNNLYGIVRSQIFEKVHSPNAGWDTCYLGQQIQKLTENMMEKYGFESIYGDTDSIMLVATDKKYNNKEYVKICLEKIVAKILHNAPFPVLTYNIDIENFCKYMMWPFSDKPIVNEKTRKLLKKGEVEGYLKSEEDGKNVIIHLKSGKIVKKGRSWVKKRCGRKKNYMFIYEDKGKKKIKLVGLPIKKVNATRLGIKIYNEFLKSKILESNSAKFPKEMVDNKIKEYLKKKEILKLLSREFRVKPAKTYKSQTSIYSQISKGYFNGNEGVICLIKNKKIGKAGKGMYYCDINEAIEAKLTIEDLDLEKVYNELSAFIKSEEVLTK